MNVSDARLCHAGNLILGAILFFSPWILALPAGPQFENALAAGGVIVVLSLAALFTLTAWTERLNIIVGLWLTVSPWALRFQRSTAMRPDVAIGIAVLILAVTEIWLRGQAPPRHLAKR